MEWSEVHKLDTFDNTELPDEIVVYLVLATILEECECGALSLNMLAVLSGKPLDVMRFIGTKKSKFGEWLSTWLPLDVARTFVLIHEKIN